MLRQLASLHHTPRKALGGHELLLFMLAYLGHPCRRSTVHHYDTLLQQILCFLPDSLLHCAMVRRMVFRFAREQEFLRPQLKDPPLDFQLALHAGHIRSDAVRQEQLQTHLQQTDLRHPRRRAPSLHLDAKQRAPGQEPVDDPVHHARHWLPLRHLHCEYGQYLLLQAERRVLHVDPRHFLLVNSVPLPPAVHEIRG